MGRINPEGALGCEVVSTCVQRSTVQLRYTYNASERGYAVGCEVSGCNGVHKARGLCMKHYTRHRRGKSVAEGSWYDLTREERFFQKVSLPAPGDTTACWIWTAGSSEGYGTFWQDGGSRYAHIVSYELRKGRVPPGLELDHLCRNKECVNHEHLEPVTHRVNMRRMMGLTDK